MNIDEKQFIELLKKSIDQNKKHFNEYCNINNDLQAQYYLGKYRALISVLYLFDKKAAIEEGY